MKRYLAEFVGTFALVFCGTGSIIVNEIIPGSVTHVGIAIVFGLIVMAMIYAFGEKSGAHLNPAVSIAFMVNGSFSAKELLPYVIGQFSGAICGSCVLKVLFPASILLGATIPSGSTAQSFIMEGLLSFFLMLVIINAAKGSKEQGLFAGIAIGAVVLLEAMFAGPVSGASMNPARSLGPALVAGQMKQLWIYLTAPVAGTVTAVGVYKLIK